jgi:membrane-bound acyltransferase YfiQ involved in biofilm formation
MAFATSFLTLCRHLRQIASSTQLRLIGAICYESSSKTPKVLLQFFAIPKKKREYQLCQPN